MIFINRLFERIARKGRIGIFDIFHIIYIIIIIIIVIIHCTHLTVLLAKILQLIWVISTKHRLVRARAMHDFHVQFQTMFLGAVCLSLFSSVQFRLDSAFVKSGIIKDSVSVISLWPWLTKLTSILIILKKKKLI